jgi:RNA polymerase sigma factor (sigma-70 family)
VSLDQPELRPEVRVAIAQLSLRQRAVVILTYWDDLTPQSIAALLRISDGSVRRHLARARSHLKETLDADD